MVKPGGNKELPGERDNARNNARCTQTRKTSHGLDGQHQDVDRTLRGRVSQNDRGPGYMEKVQYVHGVDQPPDRGRLKNRTEEGHKQFAACTRFVNSRVPVHTGMVFSNTFYYELSYFNSCQQTSIICRNSGCTTVCQVLDERHCHGQVDQ